MPPKRLDDWYRTVNSIYLDRNFYRSTESLFCHLVEVGVGGLSLAASRKRKGDLEAEQFLPKAVAWWLALCGRLGVPSVEQMLWAKFPRVCPYCQRENHDGNRCKRQPQKIDWGALKSRGQREAGRPTTLAEWQKMFGTIYVKDDNTSHEKNFGRLAEEFGELAEAIRTAPIAPQYFVSEAPDVFAWIMGFANQFDFERRIEGKPIDFEDYGNAVEAAMEAEYPDACRICGWGLCKCPPIPLVTLGRITKDAPIELVFGTGRPLFRIEESIAQFTRSEVELHVGDRRIRPDKSELDQIRSDVGRILVALELQSEMQPAILVKLAATLGTLETLAGQGAVTQASLDSILTAIASLPPERRTVVTGFLSDLAASATSATIQALVASFSAAVPGI